VYDFPSKAIGTAIPYGVYDLKRNDGVVNIGKSHNTAEFAVESIRQWWSLVGNITTKDAIIYSFALMAVGATEAETRDGSSFAAIG